MQLIIALTGRVRCIYGEAIDLRQLGPLEISRASFVEPGAAGQWLVSLAPLSGPVLGPFATRSEALHAEIEWLEANWLLPG